MATKTHDQNSSKHLLPQILPVLDKEIRKYFDFKDSEDCFRIKHHMEMFLTNACNQYEGRFNEFINARVGGKNMSDWVSWYKIAFKHVISETLRKFVNLITRQENIDHKLNGPIPCSIANRSIKKIGACYDEAFTDYINQFKIPPLTKKHRKKREENRPYAPYGLEFIPCGC